MTPNYLKRIYIYNADRRILHVASCI